MKNKKLHVIFFNSSLLKGGTEMYMMEVIRNIDKTKFHVDVLIKEGEYYDSQLYDELKSLGCEIFMASGNLINKITYLKKFFKITRHKYDIIHINATSAATGIIAYFAKRIGNIKKIIFHSHMGGNDHRFSFFDRLGRIAIKKNVDIYAACSNIASEYMFGKSITSKNHVNILFNSINLDAFNYNVKTRSEMRKKFKLKSDDYVLLHVGRFSVQKNHEYLVKVFFELNKKFEQEDNNCYLYLVGDGPLKKQIEDIVKNGDLKDKIIFCGIQNNISDFMQMADCFVMTSIHEGLPIVAVEAQAAGLPCVLSSNISKETQIVADNVCFVDIMNDNINDWVTKICEKRFYIRKSTKNVLAEKGFDSKNAIKELEKLYLN